MEYRAREGRGERSRDHVRGTHGALAETDEESVMRVALIQRLLPGSRAA